MGAALRNNPFAPFVPCHRIIASNHYIGGFFGEWLDKKKGHNEKRGDLTARKTEMLAKEGVVFDAQGYLIGGDSNIWRGHSE